MIAELRDQLESGNLRSLRASSFAGIASPSAAAESKGGASSLQEEDLKTQELIQQQDADLAEGEALEADFITDADLETKNEEELF